MSIPEYVVHVAGALDTKTGAQRCTRCGELLPRCFAGPTRAFEVGVRVGMKPNRGHAFEIPAALELDDDEIECAGAVDVGNRLDA